MLVVWKQRESGVHLLHPTQSSASVLVHYLTMGRAYVYIVRHGETQANKDHIIQGHLDTALNEVSYVFRAYLVLTWST